MTEARPSEPIQTVEASTVPGEKLSQVREMITGIFNGDVPDVVFALGSGLKQNPVTGNYRTLAYSDSGEHGLVTGSRTRVIAAADIAKALPDTKIVTTSINRFNDREPSMASVAKGELVRRGVEPERIAIEENSFNTVTQLVEIVRQAEENDWTSIAAITNIFHLPRMSETNNQLGTLVDDAPFQATLQAFKGRGGNIKFVCAEDVMRITGNHFESYWASVQSMPEYAATLAAEAKGLADLQAGNYRVTFEPEKPRIKE